MRRRTALATSYIAACVAGMIATLAYLVFGRGWSNIGFAIQLSATVGLVGGVTLSPISIPLILAAERYRWRSPLIYLAALPFLFIGGLLIGIVRIRLFAADLINIHHVLHPIALEALFCATVIAIGTYWVLSGRFAGLTR